MTCLLCKEEVRALFWLHAWNCKGARKVVTKGDIVYEHLRRKAEEREREEEIRRDEEVAREINRRRDAHRKAEGFGD